MSTVKTTIEVMKRREKLKVACRPTDSIIILPQLASGSKKFSKQIVVGGGLGLIVR